MFRKFTLYLLLLFTVLLNAQTNYTDQLKENSIFSQAPEEVKSTKPFMREWWFYEQRAYPDDYIPEGAYERAIQQRDELRLLNSDASVDINWVSLGPTPGEYFNYGNISSRIVTGAFDPVNPDIIYVGPANGGVWKSTDAGVTWRPLTDYEESLAMGSIAIDPTNTNIIYAGTGEATYSGASYYGRGLLKSTDGGNTWTRITNGLPNSTYFSRLKIRPGRSNDLLAALANSGLYRSTDAGLSWFQVVSGGVQDVVFTPTGDTVFALGGSIGLKRSIDGGATWVSYGSGLGSGTRAHFDLCLSSPNVMYAAIFGTGEVFLYKSTDYGTNWFSLPRSADFKNLDGQAWYDLYCRVSPTNPNVAYVGTIDIFRTQDGTNFINITSGYSGGSVHVDQHYLFFHPHNSNYFFACNDGGIYKSTNGGDSFINMNENLTLTQFYRIKASPFDPGRILGGTQDNGTQQTLATLNWSAVYGGDGGEVAFNPFDRNYIIGETQFGGLFRTANGGVNWVQARTGINMNENAAWVAPIIVHPTQSGTFFVARQKVYKSTNNGASWTAISGNINNASAVREMAISSTNPAVMYATTGSRIFLSTNEGVTWTEKTSGLPSKVISSVYVHPDDENIVYVTMSGFGSSKVFKSTDQGDNWIDLNGNLPDAPVNDIFIYTEDPAHPNTYFVATDIGVFISQDDGGRWFELPNGLPNTVILHLDYSPDTKMLRAGTHGRGVFEAFIDLSIPVELTSFTASVDDKKVTLSWTTSTETNNLGFEVERKLKNQNWKRIAFVEGNGTSTEEHSYGYVDDYSMFPYEGGVIYRLKQVDYDGTFDYSKQVMVDIQFMPDEYYVSQNYPNPFNPSTTIEYTLPVKSNVRIAVYNSIGQKVSELVNDLQNAGTHQVVWDASGFSSGIYFYSFEVMNESGKSIVSEMKKIVLMK